VHCQESRSQGICRDVDYVLTFEELQCIFDGVGIKLDEIAAPVYTTQATSSGIGFPLNKGVQSAMLGVLAKQDVQIKTTYAAGLERCKDQLKEVIAGKEDVQYFEGMACCNGCVDGPGALTQQGLTRVLVTKYASEAKVKTSDENELVKNNIKDLDLEV
jgi:iron only hydrogenase large subunit-like protein